MQFSECSMSFCAIGALVCPMSLVLTVLTVQDKSQIKNPNQISYQFLYCRRIKHVMDHTPYSLVKRTYTKKPMMKMTTRQKALASARHRVLSRQRAKMEIVQKNKKEEKEEEEAKDGKDAKGKFVGIVCWFLMVVGLQESGDFDFPPKFT